MTTEQGAAVVTTMTTTTTTMARGTSITPLATRVLAGGPDRNRGLALTTRGTATTTLAATTTDPRLRDARRHGGLATAAAIATTTAMRTTTTTTTTSPAAGAAHGPCLAASRAPPRLRPAASIPLPRHTTDADDMGAAPRPSPRRRNTHPARPTTGRRREA